jgi:hypothetical protein
MPAITELMGYEVYLSAAPNRFGGLADSARRDTLGGLTEALD